MPRTTPASPRQHTGGIPTDTTTYIAGIYERRVHEENGTSTTTHVYLIPAEPGVVAQIEYEEETQTHQTVRLLTDPLGSTNVVTDSSGAVLQQLFYSPFGRRIDVSGSPATAALETVRLGFTGHEHDDDVSLINMRGRMYDPRLRRFVTADPVSSEHPYTYVDNNPLRYVDPMGYYGEDNRGNGAAYYGGSHWGGGPSSGSSGAGYGYSQSGSYTYSNSGSGYSWDYSSWDGNSYASASIAATSGAAGYGAWQASQLAGPAFGSAPSSSGGPMLGGYDASYGYSGGSATGTQTMSPGFAMSSGGNPRSEYGQAQGSYGQNQGSSSVPGIAPGGLPPGVGFGAGRPLANPMVGVIAWCAGNPACVRAVAAAGAAATAGAAALLLSQSRALPRTRRGIPILYIHEKQMPGIYRNVKAGQLAGHPKLLHRTDQIQKMINRRAAIGHLPPAGIGWSWDEYPFAATVEGGAGATVSKVSNIEQCRQGAVIKNFFYQHNINVGDPFYVEAVSP